MELDKRKKSITNPIRRWMLVKSAYMGDLNLVKQCLKSNVPVDYRDSLTGDTALMAACNCKTKKLRMPLVKYLIGAGAQVFAVNNANQSGLHYSVAANDEELSGYLTTLGVHTLHKDIGGNAPMFMASKQMEKVLRKAEKKAKSKLAPVLPPSKVVQASPKPEVRDDFVGQRKTSMQSAASQLVKPTRDQDAKQSVSWSTLRGTSDCVDVLFVFIAGTGSMALPVPVKRTTSAQDVVNMVCMKLLLTEFQNQLILTSFSPQKKV
jgi:ankyrin repeat protein